ncbi:hypothetical protein PG993_005696 [Apiospora rasikravindrae]|uniref:Uncharacterized protein n=1 Tax=Apiospora rasikravindrae TaxID=990691 RepID=A0ABR1TBA6_9PEZI
MPSLLNLPREIRDEILRLALHHERSPPAGREQYEEEERVVIEHVNTACFTNGSKVFYEPRTVQPIAIPLLLANRQLHAEVQEAMARLQREEGSNCKVDVMFLEEKELWATILWTTACSRVLDRVEATIHMVGVIPDSDLPVRRT